MMLWCSGQGWNPDSDELFWSYPMEGYAVVPCHYWHPETIWDQDSDPFKEALMTYNNNCCEVWIKTEFEHPYFI